MISKREINQILTDEISELENKISNIESINKKNEIRRKIIKIGIKLENLENIFPPLLSAIMIFWLNPSMIKNPPFFIDDLEVNEKIETIDTSNGFHEEKRSFDKDYNKESIQYSTGWEKNKKGLYERTIISYKLTDDIDLNNTEEILLLSQNELQELLQITNVETIEKDYLEEDDKLFMEEAIIITKHTTSDNTKIIRETIKDNFIHSLAYIIEVAISVLGLRGIRNILIKTTLKDKLNEIESLRPINEEELIQLNQILLLKKENLSLLKEQEKPKQFRRLRKDENR